MGLSSIAVDQRQKEDEALRSFLIFSLIGSLALHIAVLTLSSSWVRETEIAEEPIELVVVDAPSLQPEEPKPKPELKAEPKPQPELKAEPKPQPEPELKVETMTRGGTSSNSGGQSGEGGGGGSPAGRTPITQAPSSSQATAPKPSVPLETLPPEPVETPKPLATPLATNPPKPLETPKPAPTRNPQPASKPKPIASTPLPSLTTRKPSSISEPPQPITPSPQSENRGRVGDRSNVAAGSRNLERSGFTSGSGTNGLRQATGTGTGNGLGNGTGTGRGSGTGTGTGTGSGTGTGTGSGTGSGSGRLNCPRSQCPDPEYPRKAKSNGWQGTVKLVFNVDTNGNVSNVQLSSSSGHDILDQAAIDTVKKWKLPSSNRERRISRPITFAIKGSDLERQARERRARQARERQQRERERQAREQQQRERERQAREQMPPSNLEPSAPLSTPVEPSPLAPIEQATPPSTPGE